MGVYISGVDMPKQDEILQIRIYGNGKVSRVYDIKCQQVGTAIETTQVVPIEEVWANVQPLKDKILELEEKLYLQNEKQKVQTINWSHDQISRAEVLALINKAMYNTDNKDIQDYLFCGLRRDVHNLPSADRPTVIRSKTLMPTKDFKEWAKRIREINPNAVVIPCDAEVMSADRPTIKQTDTLIIADALRYLVQDTERHESDRTRAEELRKQILQYGASMCHSADRPKVAYICDGRKCDNDCSECFRTLDIEHARDFKLLGDTYYQQEQADRPKGEWKWTHGGQCSECGFHNTNFDFNFCPNCGADMRGDVM